MKTKIKQKEGSLAKLIITFETPEEIAGFLTLGQDNSVLRRLIEEDSDGYFGCPEDTKFLDSLFNYDDVWENLSVITEQAIRDRESQAI